LNEKQELFGFDIQNRFKANGTPTCKSSFDLEKLLKELRKASLEISILFLFNQNTTFPIEPLLVGVLSFFLAPLIFSSKTLQTLNSFF